MNTPDRQELYNLITDIHKTVHDLAEEYHRKSNRHTDEYLSGKAVAFEHVEWLIEEKMKALYANKDKE